MIDEDEERTRVNQPINRTASHRIPDTPVLPPHYTILWSNGTPYYYANDTYYVADSEQNEYVVVAPPQGLASAQY